MTMSWTKRQFVEAAFSEAGYATYTFDLEPEQLQDALRRLDAMIATWNGKQIYLGYPLPSSPELSDLDEETEVPDAANEAIYTNLAIRIAPLIGKTVSIETRATAKSGYNALISKVSKPLERQMPRTMPSGAGNKPWRNDSPFIAPRDDGIITPPDDTLEFLP